MKIYYILILAVCLLSCTRNKKTPLSEEAGSSIENQIIKPEFQSIIDSAEVVGSILIYDVQQDIYYANDFEWANNGNLPASTFKIANSIIGLETGVIESDTTIFKWDGKEKWLKKWEQDLVLRDAFQFSCVPCYQEVARNIGVKRMNDYLHKLKYGTIVVDSSNIDKFWLEGNARISQFQQIDFLKRLFSSKLPITKRTEEIVKNIMVIEEREQYILSGKTGLSNDHESYNGWFVGAVELQTNRYLFATNLVPKKEFDFDRFIKKRMDLTLKALRQMSIIK